MASPDGGLRRAHRRHVTSGGERQTAHHVVVSLLAADGAPEPTVEELRAEMKAMQEHMEMMQQQLATQEMVAAEAVRQARAAAIREASEVIAIAELSDVLAGTLNKREARGAPVNGPEEPLYGQWTVKTDVEASARPVGATTDLAEAQNMTFSEWLSSDSTMQIPPLPSPREQSGRRRRQAAVRHAAYSAIDAAIAVRTARERESGPRQEMVPPVAGAKREVRYKRFGAAPADFPSGLIEALVERRTKARLKKHYAEADRLQKRIQRMGVRLDDRRRTWSVVKGWKKMQKAEAKAEVLAVETALSGNPPTTQGEKGATA